MENNKSVIVAGAGLWGATIARALAEKGFSVKVIEKRGVVGGNVRAGIDESSGIEVHLYGSHIFHTHIPEVWDFIRRFTEFNGYQHKVLARYEDKMYFLPLGLALINKFFSLELTPGEVKDFMSDEKNSSRLFDAFFRGYTSKQWGKAPEDIDPSIIKRVPVRDNYDINYFSDTNQGIPLDGYNSIFDRMFDHSAIEIETDREFTVEDLDEAKSQGIHVFYSGPIDRLFGYRFGSLEWRSLRFETQRLSVKDYQGTSVVNYTEADVPWTRIHEFKHYHPEQKNVMDRSETVIMREYPCDWKVGDEPYYPVNSPESAAMLEKYRQCLKDYPNLTVGGRLGEFKYYDMDQSIAKALEIAAAFARERQ